jgi:hypothetical protein
MSERKPVGSGIFALVIGLLFLAALITSFFVDLTILDPYVSF